MAVATTTAAAGKGKEPAATTAAEPAEKDKEGPEDFGDVETSSDEDDDDEEEDEEGDEGNGNGDARKKKKKKTDGSDYKGDTLLAQFDKVTRTKNRWKCVLRSGVLKLGGREALFQSATLDTLF